MQYKYDSLAREVDYFRYIILEPGSDRDPFIGQLVTSKLRDAPPYDAVSYVWGSTDRVDKFNCLDGGSIAITASLCGVLSRMRSTDRKRLLWIDQLSINQDDLAERSVQVAMMGAIYARASKTVIDLGCGDVDQQDATSVSSLVSDLNKMIDHGLAGCDGESWGALPEVEASDEIIADSRWKAFAKMLRGEWFLRVWVVQEAGLSVDPRIIYGREEFAWDSTFRVLLWIRHRGRAIAYEHHLEWHAIHMDRARIWNHEKQSANVDDQLPMFDWTFLEILEYSRQLKATNPRDHIYAFLGHAMAKSASGEPIVTPDYTATVSQVYFDFAKTWLEWTGDLDILAFVQHHDAMNLGDHLQTLSWVPMWDQFSGSVLSQLGAEIWSAGGERPVEASFRVLEAGHLRLKGLVMDCIESVSAVFEEDDFEWGKWEQKNATDDKSTVHKTEHKWRGIFGNLFSPTSQCTYTKDERFLYLAMTVAGPQMFEPLEDFRNAAATYFDGFDRGGEAIHTSLALLEDYQKGGQDASKKFELCIAAPCINRCFARTVQGYYALVPAATRPGDRWCLVEGARTPFVLRPSHREGDNCFALIGEAFVHGVMVGELLKEGNMTLDQEFELV